MVFRTGAKGPGKGKIPTSDRGGRIVTDAGELRQQATQQKQAFQEKFGYPAGEVPGIWVGQYVAVNMLGGRGGDRQLAPTRASGMLEAISLDGVVLSVEDRVVFIPRESVLQMELYETRGRGSGLRFERHTPEPPADPSDPDAIGTE
jgi:hypothetical protein